MKLNYLQQPRIVPIAYLTNTKSERTFEVSEEITVTLSDGSILTIPKGLQTDLSSVPSWLWSFIKPMDTALIADIIHDALWIAKVNEINRLGSSYIARKFADTERLKWRKALAPKKTIKNYLTHYTIRLIGGFFYSQQIQIPN